MSTAFWFDSTFGAPLVDDGKIVGESSGHTLLRRLMALVEDPILLGTAYIDGDGFKVRPVGWGDVNKLPIVSFNPSKTLELYRLLKKTPQWHHPKLMNFVWFNPAETSDRRLREMDALSYALFPTWCNSAGTVQEVRQEIRSTLGAARLNQVQVAGENLGVEHLPMFERPHRDRLRVLYPAMWLFDRKRPELFLTAMAKVAAKRDVEVVMNLSPRQVVPMPFREHSWLKIGRVLPREEYVASLSSIDIALATSSMESYGLQYLELIQSGVVMLMPDIDWARRLLPDDYPFWWRGVDGAASLAMAVADDIEGARHRLVPYQSWIEAEHDPVRFDRRFVGFLRGVRTPAPAGDAG